MTKACAIILAAGQGTRMKSKYPKALCQVLFKPMINWVTDWCLKAGIEEICVVTGQGAQYLEPVLPKQCCTVSQPQQLGTGHAVMMARSFIGEHRSSPILVLNGDAPFVDDAILNQALEQHIEQQAQVTVITAELGNPAGYGRIVRAQDGTVQAIVEERDATESQRAICEVNSGAYCFDADFLLDGLEKLGCKNAQGEYYLTDLVGIAVSERKKVCACRSRDEKVALGANDRAGLLKLNEIANKIEVDRLLEDGVNFYCTDGVVISPDAVVGRDTTLGPGTQLKGHVVIGEDCDIGPSTIIENSTIGNGCQIHSSFIERSVVGNGVRIGPNSHLRPDSVLGDGVKIGNFVEIKNSTLGEKTSVAHLTYIGDSANSAARWVTTPLSAAIPTWCRRSMWERMPISRQAPPLPRTCSPMSLPLQGRVRSTSPTGWKATASASWKKSSRAKENNFVSHSGIPCIKVLLLNGC